MRAVLDTARTRWSADGDPCAGAARHWHLDPAVTYLNHGSFGACPIPVLKAQSALRYLHRPASLEDVFLKLTGRDLRD